MQMITEFLDILYDTIHIRIAKSYRSDPGFLIGSDPDPVWYGLGYPKLWLYDLYVQEAVTHHYCSNLLYKMGNFFLDRQ